MDNPVIIKMTDLSIRFDNLKMYNKISVSLSVSYIILTRYANMLWRRCRCAYKIVWSVNKRKYHAARTHKIYFSSHCRTYYSFFLYIIIISSLHTYHLIVFNIWRCYILLVVIIYKWPVTKFDYIRFPWQYLSISL